MKKKTILLGLLVAGMAVTSVSGCSSKKTDSNNSSEQQNQTKPAGVHTVYYVVDGKVVSSIDYKDGDTSIIEIGVPKKEGYEGVWSSYSLNGEDVYVVAVYYKKNVDYSIEYYLQNLDNDGYTKDDDSTSHFSTTEYSTVTPTIKSFTGFSCINSTIEQSIDETNNVIKVYYDRNTYTIDYTTNNGLPIDSQTVKYGTVVSQPNIVKNGYTLINWTNNNQVYDFTQPVNKNLDLVANWEANEGIQYKINYYLENVDNDEYTLSDEYSKTLTGNTDEAISASDVKPEGFELDTTKSIMEGTISYDGKTELNVYYNRKRFTATFKDANGEVASTQNVKYGQKINEPTLEKEGYTFSCFKSDGVNYNFDNPVTKNLVLEAFYIPNTSTMYSAQFFYENIENDDYTFDSESTYYGTTDEYTPITGYSIPYGFTLTNPSQQEIIKADGSTIVKYYFKRNRGTISFITNNGDLIESTIGKYGQPYRYVIPSYSKEGYDISYYSYRRGYLNDDYSLDTCLVDGDDTISLNVTPKEATFNVEFYFENLLDDDFILDETQTIICDSYTDHDAYIPDYGFEGFEFYEAASTTTGKVKYDGSTTLKIYLKRIIYTISFTTGDDSIIIPTKTYKYGTKLTDPNIYREGYTLKGWTDSYNGGYWDFNYDIACYDVELVADWTANTIKTKVEYYYENIIDDDYTLVDTKYMDTVVDYEYNASYNTPSGFTLNSNSITTAYINPDGSTVFKLYFDRYTYNVKIYNYNEYGNQEVIENYTVKYGTVLEAPEVSRQGYDLSGWSYDFSQPIDTNRNIYPNYVARTDTAYTINIYIEDVDGNEWELANTFTEYGTTDSTFSQTDYCENYINLEHYNHFDHDNPAINGDGSTVVNIYYTRPQYEITITYDDHVSSNLGRYYYYGKELELIPEFDGNLAYEFLGIYDEDDNYIGDTFSFTVTENLSLYIKTKEKDELSIFRYYSSDEYLTIEGFKDDCDTEDLVIPDCATEISRDAFYNNTTIKTITLGENLKTIGYRAFYNIINLESIYLNDGLEIIENESFENADPINVTINNFPSSLKEINSSAFYNIILDKISFESNSNLEYIGSYAFGYNTNYDNDTVYDRITIPRSVITIENRAFYDVNFNELYFEEDSKLECIGYYAFSSNTLKYVSINTFPKSLKEIRAYAFYNTILDKIEFYNNSNLETIGERAFAYNLEYDVSTFYNRIFIPNNVVTIDSYAFYGVHFSELYFEEDSKLEIISSNAFATSNIESSDINYLPNSIKTIGQNAFYNRILDNIQFEEDSSLEYIGQYAFSYNTSYEIEKIYDGLFIPSSVTEISSYAFYGVHFNELYFDGDSKLEIMGSNAFGLANKDDILISELTLPASLKVIDEYVFYNRLIDEFRVEDGINLELESYALGQTYINKFYYNIGIDNSNIWGLYGASIDELIIPNDITTIPEYAFYGASIKTATFENNSIVEKISDNAFNLCYLESIILPDSLKEIGDYAFYSNHLKTIDLNKVEKIGEQSFYDNPYLTVLIIGQSLYEIGSDSFSTTLEYIFNKSIYKLAEGEADYGTVPVNSDSLIFEGLDAEKAELRDGFVIYYVSELETRLLKYIGNEKQVTIPIYITSIGHHAFYDDDNIEEVVISNHITYIGEYAFYSCSNLENVVIGNSVEIIDRAAFQYCKKLKNIVISDSVTTINQYAFYGCEHLTTLTLGENVTEIRYNAFEDCLALVEIYNKSSLELEIGSSVAYYAKRIVDSDFESYVTFEDDFAIFNYNNEVYLLYYEGEETEQLVIPDYFTVIGTYAFKYTNIKSFVLGENIKELEKGAFYYSSNYLEEVIFNDKLEVIGDYAFHQCYLLNNVVLPDSVEFIGNNAFDYIPNLCITVGSGLTTIGDGAFHYSLKEFNFSGENNIEYIGDNAFDNCGLISFELGENINTIGNDAFAGAYIYEIKNDSSLVLTMGSADYGKIALNCRNIYSSTFGESIIVTDENGFTYFSTDSETVLVRYNGLAGEDVDLVIPESVTVICSNVFENLTFGNIIISKNVEFIRSYAFNQIFYKTLTFEEGSLLEIIEDRAFFSCEMMNIYGYDDYYQEELILPDNLLEIGDSNFGSIRVKRIYIPASVTKIGQDSFWNDTELEYLIIDENSTMDTIKNGAFGAGGYGDIIMTVIIPVSVQTIEAGSIYDENGVAYYLYYGNETQWSNVTVSTSNYEVYYYSETAPASEGNYWHFDVDGNPVIWTLMTEPITE